MLILYALNVDDLSEGAAWLQKSDRRRRQLIARRGAGEQIGWQDWRDGKLELSKKDAAR